MTLPVDFQFSQSSLQDYVDCSRRFQLRYIRRLRWPAIEMLPSLENERYLRQGAAFHRLVRQHLMGLPLQTLRRSVTDPELRRWWRNYVERGLIDLPSRRYPEVRLSTSLGDVRLVAQYDLVATGPGERVVIVDWKTNRKLPSRERLSERLQTRVYPYVIVRSGDALDIGPTGPDDVTMVYWFANFPSAPVRFAYTADQYRADERYLSHLVDQIVHALDECSEGDLLPPTQDDAHCRICRYRSLCERGVEPGWGDAGERGKTPDELFDVALDFEQIGELELG